MSKWEMVRLGDVFLYIKNGANIKQESTNSSGYPITRIETISAGVVNRAKMGYAGIDVIEPYESYVLQDGDILMSHINSVKHLGKVALYAHKDSETIIHGMNLLNLRADEKRIDSLFAYYFLTSYDFRKQLPNITKNSVNQSSFNITALKELKAPLPPLATQQKIADILDCASALIEKRKAQIAKLDLLVKSQFVTMFGDPVVNPMGWDVKEVIDVCDCMVPGRDKPKSFTGDIPWITIDDLVVNGLTTASKKGMGLTKGEVLEVKRKPVPIGSVLMSCVGNLGICSIAGKELVINQQLHSFQCGEFVNHYYLMHYLGCRVDYMNRQATSTTVLYMNKSVCNSIPLMLPPLDLQTRFADFVHATNKSKAEMQRGLGELELLYKALMQKCFVGELF